MKRNKEKFIPDKYKMHVYCDQVGSDVQHIVLYHSIEKDIGIKLAQKLKKIQDEKRTTATRETNQSL